MNEFLSRQFLVVHVAIETADVLNEPAQRNTANDPHALFLQDVPHSGVVGEHVRRAAAEAHVAREPEVELDQLRTQSLAVELRFNHQEAIGDCRSSRTTAHDQDKTETLNIYIQNKNLQTFIVA